MIEAGKCQLFFNHCEILANVDLVTTSLAQHICQREDMGRIYHLTALYNYSTCCKQISLTNSDHALSSINLQDVAYR